MVMDCDVCGEENKEEALFCKKCVSPINVQKISDYTKEDKDHMLSLLLKFLSEKKESNPESIESEYFEEYINAYWLRPESAVWRTKESEFLKGKLIEPLLDLGCGDGINMAILKGWKFSREYDSFQAVKFEKDDIYDNFDESYAPKINEEGDKAACAIDIKPSLVEKAKILKVYEKVIQGDIHNVPVEDLTFKTVYSNVLKDFKNVSPILKEVHRILQEDGMLIFNTPTDKFKKNLYFINKAKELKKEGNIELAEKYVEYDRGRSVYSATQWSIEKWEKVLNENGFKLIEYMPYNGPAMMKFWDVGFRPFSVDLIEMYEKMKSLGVGLEFKNMFISKIMSFFSMYLDDMGDKDGGFMFIIAQKLS